MRNEEGIKLKRQVTATYFIVLLKGSNVSDDGSP
jgi:hypothetical protein